MATKSSKALRRTAVFAMTLLLLLSFPLVREAAGQVTASSSAGLSHPTGWGTIRDSAIDSLGDWFVVDYSNGALYEFPAGGGAAVTLGPPGPTGAAGSVGQGNNPGIAIDPNNNIYLEANWNNCLVMFPYAGNGTWSGLNAPNPNTLTVANSTTTICTNSGKSNETNAWAQYGLTAPASSGFPGYFQPWGIAIGANNTILVSNQSSGNYIFSLGVNNAWTNPTAGAVTNEEINTMSARPISVAQDPEGNIYFVEEPGQSHALSGVYEIPAGTPELSSDSGLTRVDPNLPAVTGLITDSTGNLYISDATDGVFMVPNPLGTPQTSSAVLITPVPAQGEVSIDFARKILYVPTTQTQSNGEADIAEVAFGFAEFGASGVGKATTAATPVNFSFNGSATPANFAIVEGGSTKPDFSITGGTCTTGTAYAALSACTENLAFTPAAVGSVSAKLLMLDAKNNILSSIVLHGTGTGANVQVNPAMQSAIGSGLKSPSQVATDALGDVFIADPGQGKVLMYAAGSSTAISIGTGLTSPTGVAVDGGGDVFIADSSAGSVYEIPFGPSGRIAAGQVTLLSGLGTTGLSLAVDALDDLYIADPSNKRVVKLINAGVTGAIGVQSESLLTTGFNSPSAVAVDPANNLYVIDGSNLFLLAGGAGTPTALLNNLSGASGLAVDASGAVYISSASGTTRIPSIGGSLAPAAETTVASSLSNTSSVALDRAGNVYITQATGGSVALVGTNSALALPAPSGLTSSTSAIATVTNSGNSPLSVTGYTSSNSVDFNGADTTSGGCIAGSPVAVGATCTVNVTFNPGPGEQGTLTSTIGVTSNAVNVPVAINASGTGLTLANSVTAGNVGNTAQVISTPLSVSVAPKAGSGVNPTGTVTVTFASWTVTTPSGGSPTITPTTLTMTSPLVNGAANFALSPVLAGSQTFTINYSGDRVYGRSTGTMTASVAKSAVMAVAVPTFPDPTDANLPFVLEQDGSTPYDGSQAPWQYQYKMNVNTAAGIPTGTITVMDNSSACPPGTSTNGIGAATCALTGYNGVACPQSAGAATLTIANSGGTTGAGGSFPTSCLPMPQNTTYTPIISTHYITPVYSGDANFLTFNGPSVLIQAVRSPVVQIATSSSSSLTAPPTLSVQPGATASLNLTLSSILGYGIAGRNSQLNDYNFPVSLACDNLPPHAVCTINYPNPDPNISTAVDIPCPSSATATQVAAGTASCAPGLATVTINTNVSVGTTNTSRNAAVTSITLASIFGLGMMGLYFRRKTFEKGRYLMMVILMIIGGALLTSVTACSTTNLAPLAQLSTPGGTYAVTITAQQVGSQAISLPTGPVEIYGSQNQVSLPFYINVTVQ